MPGVNFKLIPTDVPLSVENIDRIAKRAEELARAFAARIANIQQQVHDARQRFGREADDLVRETEPANRPAAREFSKRQEASRIAKFRGTIEESSRAQREELLKLLAKLATDAAFLLTLNHSPAQMLGRVALGEVKRTQYQVQLEGAGPIELETAAVTAIATGDVVLAAAIVTVIDRKPATKRPFPVAEFAGRMWGAQHAEVTGKLKGVILAERTARAANDEFVRGRADPLTNLLQPARAPRHRRGGRRRRRRRGGRGMKRTSMPSAVPNVRKAKAIHEKKQAERAGKLAKFAKRAKATRGH